MRILPDLIRSDYVVTILKDLSNGPLEQIPKWFTLAADGHIRRLAAREACDHPAEAVA